MIWFNIEVLPEARRQGLAREMLRHIATHARSQERSLLTVDCHDRAPAGPAFLERIGAHKGLVEAMNQVRVADLDRELVDHWLERRLSLLAEFELGFWDAPYPSERLQDLADLLQEVANDQPRDTLQMDDINYTPALMQQFDDEQRLGGDQRWTLYAVHRGEGRLAGITEVYWNPNRPRILWQGFTGVMPAYRGSRPGALAEGRDAHPHLARSSAGSGHSCGQCRFQRAHAEDQSRPGLPALRGLGHLAGGTGQGGNILVLLRLSAPRRHLRAMETLPILAGMCAPRL